MSDIPGHRNLLVERRGAVGIVTLNRPQALNALNAALISELASALDDLETDAGIGAIVLTLLVIIVACTVGYHWLMFGWTLSPESLIEDLNLRVKALSIPFMLVGGSLEEKP